MTTITDTTVRTEMITGFVRALVRHKIGDDQCLLTVEQIDAKTEKADMTFMLRLLRLAAPLYPLPPLFEDRP